MALNAGKIVDEGAKYFSTLLHPPAPSQGNEDKLAKYTNGFVEAARASPYFVGHIDQIVHPTWLILVVVEIVRAFA